MTPYDEYVNAFNQGVPNLERRDWQDESLHSDGTAPRSTANMQKRGIIRWLKHEAQCWEDAFCTPETVRQSVNTIGLTPAALRVRDMLEALDSLYEQGHENDHQQTRVEARWHMDRQQDVMDNFLYHEWRQQLDSRHPIRTYSLYSLYVATKAALALVSSTHERSQTLRDRHPRALPFPDREKAVRFRELAAVEDSHNWTWFLSNVGVEVPGIFEAAETLLTNYGDIVRAAQHTSSSDTPTTIPDDPAKSVVSDADMLELAISAYLAEEGNFIEVAKKYGIPKHRFRTTLIERGLIRSRGGNQRK